MKSNYKIGDVIRVVDNRNGGLLCDNLKGLSMTKEFRSSTSNIVGTDLSKYKIVQKKQFAVDFMSVIRVHKIPIALNISNEAILVSPAYTVFEVKDENIILTDYLMMWFSRPEFDRYADFRSDAAIRGGYGWNELCDTNICIPPIKEQLEIVASYKAITDRIALKKRINDNLSDTASTLFQKLFLASSDKDQWPIGTFSHFIHSTVGGDWGQESPTSNYTQEVSCIRGTDIPLLNAGSISSAPTRYILPKNFLAKRIKANDLVVEISGGSPVQATGRIALVPQQVLDYRGNKLICSNFCRIVTVDTIYLQYFLQYWLYLYNAGRMFDYENSSTGLKNFDFSSFVEKEPIPIPPEDVVQGYNKIVWPLYRQLFSNGFEIETLQETQQHILPRIMLHGF